MWPFDCTVKSDCTIKEVHKEHEEAFRLSGVPFFVSSCLCGNLFCHEDTKTQKRSGTEEYSRHQGYFTITFSEYFLPFTLACRM